MPSTATYTCVPIPETSSLTKGVFEVTGKKAASGFTEEELIEYAACAESYFLSQTTYFVSESASR